MRRTWVHVAGEAKGDDSAKPKLCVRIAANNEATKSSLHKCIDTLSTMVNRIVRVRVWIDNFIKVRTHERLRFQYVRDRPLIVISPVSHPAS